MKTTKTRGGFSPSLLLQKYAVIIAWIILFISFSIWMPGVFNSMLNVKTILGSQAVLVVASLAVLIPIIAGDYDMSVAATLTVVNIVVAKLNVDLGLPIGVCIVIGLACLLFREATFQEVVPPFVTAFCVTVVSATAELLVEGIGGLCGKIGGFIID